MSKFHYFQELPPELREMIWDMSLEPRVIILRDLAPQSPDSHHNPPPPIWQGSTTRPASLQTAFAGTGSGRRTRTSSGPGEGTRINFAIDTIRIEQLALKTLMKSPEADLIQRLALPVASAEAFYYPMGPSPCGRECLLRFKNLKEVTFIHEEPKPRVERKNAFQYDYMDFFRDYYYTCSPVQWNLRVVCEDYPDALEMNRDNYLTHHEDSVERHRKKNAYSKAKVTGLDSYGKRWQWSHPRSGCNCASQQTQS